MEVKKEVKKEVMRDAQDNTNGTASTCKVTSMSKAN